MGTLTKLTDVVTDLADYTLYGSPTNPIIEEVLVGDIVSPASIVVNLTAPGDQIQANPYLFTFTGPNSGDQILLISVRTDSNPAPTVPDRAILFELVVDTMERPDIIASSINNLLANSQEIFESSLNITEVTFRPRCGGTWTAVQNSGVVTTAVVTQGTVFSITDPHRTFSLSQVRWFDPLIDLELSAPRVAPNFVIIGSNCIFNLDNFNLNLDAGFALDTRFADDTTLNWDQVNYYKTGDSQGINGGSKLLNRPLFTPETKLISNFKNCSFNMFPVISNNNNPAFRSNFMFINGNVDGLNITNWENVNINYSGNVQMDFKLINDSANSSILNSKLVLDGISTRNNQETIVVFPFVRLLTPFGYELQTETLQINSLTQEVTDEFSNFDLLVGTNLTGPIVADPTYINNVFQNRGSFIKFLDFTILDVPYINAANYSQLSSTLASNTEVIGYTDYAASFDPNYFDSTGSPLSEVRVECRYGDSTESSPLNVKEMCEAGEIGGISASIVRFNSTVNLVAGSVFTIPRPHGESNVTLTESSTPVNSGTDIQFTLGATLQNTFDSIRNAVRDAEYFNIWVSSKAISLNDPELIIGNNIGGTTSSVPFCDDTVLEATKTILETGLDGIGVNTHPFEDDKSYIIEGLFNTNTLTDNSFKANTTTGRNGVGNNNGLFLTYNKTNLKNNTLGGSLPTTTLLYNLIYTTYEKRAGFRPQISSHSFSTGRNAFSKTLVTDIHWEDITKATADAYVSSDMVNFNDVYRWVENLTDDRGVTDQDTLPSVYTRFINLESPVDAGALIDFGAFDIALNTTGIKPSYDPNTGGTFGTLTIPISTSITRGPSIIGLRNDVDITLSGTIDLQEGELEALNEFTAENSDITNGYIKATTHNLNGSNITNTHIGSHTENTLYTINHSGGEFQDVQLDSLAELFTDDGDLHGLFADNIKIFYTGTTQDFSVDSPGQITDSEFFFRDITQNIEWVIDEDLSTCTATNETAFNISIDLGSKGVVPTLIGNFSLARTLDLGLQAGETINYRVVNSSTKALVEEDFTGTFSNIISFDQSTDIDFYAVRTDVFNTKPIAMWEVPGNIITQFMNEDNLDISIQLDVQKTSREKIDAYYNNSSLILDSSNNTLNLESPNTFVFDGVTQEATSEVYWDANGARGGGQYLIKLFERDKNYAIVVLDNQTALEDLVATQLFEIITSDRLLITTTKLQLHSLAANTGTAFFPGQFVADLSIPDTFSIVGSIQAFIETYQSVNVVDVSNEAIEIFNSEVGGNLDGRRVTRQNLNLLGILAPINDKDPT